MKHKFIAKRYWKDQSTAMGQSDEMAKSFDDVINLSLGDPDMTTPEPIIEAAFRDAKAGHTKYTDFRGDPELRAEICRYYEKNFGMPVRDEEVFVTASACLGMYLALEAILDDGDEVILQAPYFTPYPQQVELARGIPVELATYEEEDFQVNVERLENLITERTKALVINSPNNPTGNCLTTETMREIARIAEAYDLIVISDEIYTAYSYQHPFVPFASLPGMTERTITLNSFSKDFVMTGCISMTCMMSSLLSILTLNIIAHFFYAQATSCMRQAAMHAQPDPCENKKHQTGFLCCIIFQTAPCARSAQRLLR